MNEQLIADAEKVAARLEADSDRWAATDDRFDAFRLLRKLSAALSSDVAQAPQSAGIFVRRSTFGPWIEVEKFEPGAVRLYAAPVAAQAPEQVGNNALVLTGAQLLEALDFIAPDRATDPEQMEATVAIEYGKGHGGEAMYVWCAEYPEEGSFVLDGAIPAPQAPVADGARAPTDAEIEAMCESHGLGPNIGKLVIRDALKRWAAPAQQAVTLTDDARDAVRYRALRDGINNGPEWIRIVGSVQRAGSLSLTGEHADSFVDRALAALQSHSEGETRD